MRYTLVSAALGLIVAGTVAAQAPDTLASRREAATRFAEMVDVQSIIDKYLESTTADLQPEERERVRALLKKHLRVAALRELKVAAMASTFTTQELTAMEAFYRTEEGRSILSKYSAYLVKVLPAVSEEVEREISEMKAEVEKAEHQGSRSPKPVDIAQDTGTQHERLRHLLAESQTIEITLHTRIQFLEDKYGSVDVTNLYQTIDLSTIAGIHAARQRVDDCSAKYQGFASAQEQHWAKLAVMVKSNNLNEPQASGLRASFAADEAEEFANYRAWFTAARADIAAVAHLLDIAERHLGHLKWQQTRLTATDERTATDLAEANNAIAAMDRRFDETGRAALGSPHQTFRFIRVALLELEQGMPRRD